MNVFTDQHGRLRKTEYVIPRDNTSGLCSWDTHVRSRQKKKIYPDFGFPCDLHFSVLQSTGMGN